MNNGRGYLIFFFFFCRLSVKNPNVKTCKLSSRRRRQRTYRIRMMRPNRLLHDAINYRVWRVFTDMEFGFTVNIIIDWTYFRKSSIKRPDATPDYSKPVMTIKRRNDGCSHTNRKKDHTGLSSSSVSFIGIYLFFDTECAASSTKLTVDYALQRYFNCIFQPKLDDRNFLEYYITSSAMLPVSSAVNNITVLRFHDDLSEESVRMRCVYSIDENNGNYIQSKRYAFRSVSLNFTQM